MFPYSVERPQIIISVPNYNESIHQSVVSLLGVPRAQVVYHHYKFKSVQLLPYSLQPTDGHHVSKVGIR
jgi:hypothetical protein